MDIVAGIRSGQRRAAARLITLLENDDPAGVEALHALHGELTGAHVIGVTGSPGTGKSTLTDRLIEFYRRSGLKVGVVAVDPSSPFTGGAILGDRIRMQSRSNDPDVFIRSMGTRGALGGLSSHTADAVRVLDALGKDIIIVETVGVGQAEVDVVQLADTVVVVLVPNLGDDVQAVKAGIMEIADIFVVNKSDIDGADKVVAEVEANLALAHPEEGDWFPPRLKCVAERGHGTKELTDAIAEHLKWSRTTGEWETRRARRLHRQVRGLLERRVVAHGFRPDGSPRPRFVEAVESARAGKISPQSAADAILGDFAKTLE